MKTLSAIGAAMVALIFAAGICSAQGPERPRPRAAATDTVFNEINLTRDGVTAVDTAGNRWLYNFETSGFIPDQSEPQTARRGERLSGDLPVAGPVDQRCTQQKFVKPFQKDVLVGYDEYVAGDIVAYGRVIVKGWVKGDVQSISDRVIVAASGQVDGDIKAPEIINDGGRIGGRQVTTNPLEFPREVLSKSFLANGLFIVFSITALLLVIGFLSISLFPRQVGNLRECLIRYKARSVFVGVLMIFLLPLIILVFVITIIGIILLPLLPIAMALAMGLGVVGWGHHLGQSLWRRLARGEHSQMFNSLLGVLVFMLLWFVVASLLAEKNGTVAHGFGIFLLVVAILISFYPVFGGLGAAFLTRFGFRQHTGTSFGRRARASEAPAPAPPPLPDVSHFMAPPVTPPTPEPPPPGRPQRLGPDSKPPLAAGNG